MAACSPNLSEGPWLGLGSTVKRPQAMVFFTTIQINVVSVLSMNNAMVMPFIVMKPFNIYGLHMVNGDVCRSMYMSDFGPRSSYSINGLANG